MGTGYTRNDTSNNIADGNIINAADLDGEFDAIESAMGTGGHTHDGTSAEGGPVTVLGPVQDFVASATEIKPKTTNTLDIGTSGLLFKDMFLDGVATMGSIKIDNAGTIGSASDADAIAISSGGVVSFSQNTIGKTGSGYVLSLQTSDTTIEATNVLGKIEFSAPDEASGTDAILVGASIEALAEGTFSSSVNSTALVFKTNTTGAATERMRLTSAGDLHFLDNRKAIFGAGSDLQIYHSGAASFITENGTGDLNIQGNNLVLEDPSGNNYLFATSGGAVSLFHNAGTKLATTATGVDITGTLVSDGLTVDGTGVVGTFSSSNNNTVLRVKGNGATNGGAIGSTSSDDLVLLSGLTEKMRIDSSGNVLVGGSTIVGPSSGAVQKLEVQGTGATETGYFVNHTASYSYSGIYNASDSNTYNFWKSGNNYLFGTVTSPTTAGWTERMRIDSSGNVGIGTTLPSRTLSVNGAAGFGNGTIETIVSFSDRGIFGTQSNHDLELRTNATERMRIDSSGNVGIGTDSPSQVLSVESSSVGVTRVGVTNTGNAAAGAGVQFITKNGATQVSNATLRTDNAGNFSIFTGTTGETERMRIDSSGRVGIGTTNPSSSLGAGGLHVTDRIAVGSGSAGTPALHYDSDTDTGLFFGTGVVAVGTGGTERMRIDSSGNVAIGHTSANSSRLHLKGAGSAGTPQLMITDNSSGKQSEIRQDTSGNLVFDHWTGANRAERMRIDSSGNVGIGTTSPDRALHVNTSQDYVAKFSSSDAGAAILLEDSNSTANYNRIGVTTHDMQFVTNNSEAMRIDSSGNVGIGTSSPSFSIGNGLHIDSGGYTSINLQKGTSGGGGHIIDFTDASNTIQYRIGTNFASGGENLLFAYGSTPTVGIAINSSGQVGIGTASPTGSLHTTVKDSNGSDVFVVAQNTTSNRVAGFRVLDESGTTSLQMQYDNGGNNASIINPNNGSLAIYLGGTGAANKLDDYEEGTYETAITASGSGTVTLNAVYDELSYVKVGNIVHVQGFISISSVSSPTGYFKIDLPFTSKSGVAYRASASLSLNGVSTNNVADFWGIVDDNTNHIQVYLGDSSSVQTDSAQTLQGGSDCRLQVTYQAA